MKCPHSVPSKHKVLPAITQYSPGEGQHPSRGRSRKDPPWDGKVFFFKEKRRGKWNRIVGV